MSFDWALLDKWEELHSQTTPGKWRYSPDVRPDILAHKLVEERFGTITTDAPGEGFWGDGELVHAIHQNLHENTIESEEFRVACFSKYAKANADADFIAEAHEAMPELIGLIRQLHRANNTYASVTLSLAEQVALYERMLDEERTNVSRLHRRMEAIQELRSIEIGRSGKRYMDRGRELEAVRAELEQFASIKKAYELYCKSAEGDAEQMTLAQFAHSCVADMLEDEDQL